MGVRKVKAYKKLSMRERMRREGSERFGKQLSGCKRVSLDLAIDRFIREASCRHSQSLGSPCVSFYTDLDGICKRDGRTCDILTAKGERYRLEYE